jgi:hypothetical protein
LRALLLLQLFEEMVRARRERRRLLRVQGRGSRRALFRRHAANGGPAMRELDGDLGAGVCADVPGRGARRTQELVGGG